jgi:NTE family protein
VPSTSRPAQSPPSSGPTALVLAGGGARGAYEVGALSVLAPALTEDERPQIVLGTSVGAINAAYLAAHAAQPLDQVAADGLSLWSSIGFNQVLRPLLSLPEAARLGGYIGEVLGIRGLRADSILDPQPLQATLKDLIPFEQIHENVAAGHLQTAAVVASSAATKLSVVFHDGGPEPARDVRRRIDYVPTALTEDHVRASAAIPLLFPAVPLNGDGGRSWYFDGGTRLNTPIKPALELGARRVIVIALNSVRPRQPGPREPRPDALDGAAQLIQAVLVDPLVNDVHTLATINEILGAQSTQAERRQEQRTGKHRIPYMLIAPKDPDEIARAAIQVYRKHYGGAADLLRAPNVAALGRLVSATSSIDHGELLSYLFFAREFAQRLIELGQRDAQRWLSDPSHDHGKWQLGPLA